MLLRGKTPQEEPHWERLGEQQLGADVLGATQAVVVATPSFISETLRLWLAAFGLEDASPRSAAWPAILNSLRTEHNSG